MRAWFLMLPGLSDVSARYFGSYTAVQFALLTSFMQLLGKFVIVPSSGFLVEGLGWVNALSWLMLASWQ